MADHHSKFNLFLTAVLHNSNTLLESGTRIRFSLTILAFTPIHVQSVPLTRESHTTGRQLQVARPEGTSAIPCAAPTTRFCTTCDACCKDLDANDCQACTTSMCSVSHRCTPGTPAGCNVCSQCCEPFLVSQADCDACVNDICVPAEEAQISGSCNNHGTQAALAPILSFPRGPLRFPFATRYRFKTVSRGEKCTPVHAVAGYTPALITLTLNYNEYITFLPVA